MPDKSLYEIGYDNEGTSSALTSTTLDDPVFNIAKHTTYNPFLHGQVVKHNKYIRNPTPSSSMRLSPVSVSSDLRHRKRKYQTTQAVSERLSSKRQRSSAMPRKKRRRSTARKSRHPSPAWKSRDPSPAWKSRDPSPAWKSHNSPTPDYQVNKNTHIDFRHIDPDKMDGDVYNLVKELTKKYFEYHKNRGLTDADAMEEAERNIVERHRLGDFYNNPNENGQRILYPVKVVNKLDPTSPSPSPSCGNCMGIRLWGGKKSRRLKKQKQKPKRKTKANKRRKRTRTRRR